jgi:hypothetical protein
MAAKDESTHQFCNYISDQQDFKPRSGPIVTLPSTYAHSWADGKGNYFLTDDPTFDPRGLGTGNWEKLEKATPQG